LPDPATISSIAHDLRALGVAPGMTLLVHSSLRSLGFVCGAAVAVIYALQEALGPEGTLVMPTHTSVLTEPAYWVNPPVPTDWFEIIRNETPAFDPDFTPASHMGIIPETFRRGRGVIRSSHPTVSFAARGPRAVEIVGEHPLEYGLGETSPLGALYALDAHILLLGVDHDRNTSIHLAEVRTEWPGKLVLRQGSPIMRDGERVWATYDELDYDSTDFLRIGRGFELDTDFVRIANVARAESRLMRIRPLVTYAAEWMRRMRPESLKEE
jgi:aminoglycoside 3-N-acetyltransferase